MTEPDNIYLLPDMKKSEAEAAEWVARLEGGEMTPAEHAALARWQAESDHNRDAFERYTRLWDGLDALEGLNDYASRDMYAAPPFRQRVRAALPLLAAMLIAVVAGKSSLTDPLAFVLLGARIVQSTIHLASLSATAVTLRFSAFAVQMGIGVYWALLLLAM